MSSGELSAGELFAASRRASSPRDRVRVTAGPVVCYASRRRRRRPRERVKIATRPEFTGVIRAKQPPMSRRELHGKPFLSAARKRWINYEIRDVEGKTAEWKPMSRYGEIPRLRNCFKGRFVSRVLSRGDLAAPSSLDPFVSSIRLIGYGVQCRE